MNDLNAQSLRNAFDQLLDIMSYAMRELGYESDEAWIGDYVSSHHHAELYEILEEREYV